MSMATTTRLPSPSTSCSRPPEKSQACTERKLRYEIRIWDMRYEYTCRQNSDYERLISAFLSDFAYPFMYRFFCEIDWINVFYRFCWGLISLFTRLWLSIVNDTARQFSLSLVWQWWVYFRNTAQGETYRYRDLKDHGPKSLKPTS